MEKSHYEGTKVEKTQGWHMVKSLSVLTIVVHAGKHPNVFRRPYGTLVEGEPSTTRFKSRYRRANKGGNPEYLYH